MDKKYINKFYDEIANVEKYQIFAISLPMLLINKHLYNQSEQFYKSTYDLLHSDIDVLASLYFNDEVLSPTELSASTIFSSGGMTKVLKKLKDRNLIKREADINDKRSLLVVLTKEGKELMEDCLDKLIHRKEDFYGVLSSEEKDQLKGILAKLINSMD